ncbi:transposase [Bacillus coagulans]|nr:T7SS effector LXG polymorphic toxin [Heyndrickxia coagulans]NCG68095.1 transposase [Heyndrickxia coagulans]
MNPLLKSCSIDNFVDMQDAFKGKAMAWIFWDFHQPFLLYLQSFLADYNGQLNQILKDLSYFEPDPNGYIEEAFIQNNVIPALKKLENAIGYLLEDANKAMRKVSDLAELKTLDIDEKLYPIQKAHKKANKTLEQLYDFDTKATRSLEALDQDIDTMIKFVRQMESMAGAGSFDIATYNPKQFVTTEAYRSLEGGLLQKAGAKQVQTVDGKDFEGHFSVKFHRYEDGVLVMEYRKPDSKQPHYELVDEIPKQAIPGSENPDDPLLLDIWKGIYDGAGKAIGDTINGLLSLGKSALDHNTYSSIRKKAVDYGNKLKSSPIATLNSTAHKTIDMAKYMGQTVQNAFERDVIHGDAKSRTEFFTYGLTSIGISLIGDKGLSKLGTATKAVKAGKLAEKAERLKVNTGFVPALEAAGAGKIKIPYNVMDELGVRIQRATEERWGNNENKAALNKDLAKAYLRDIEDKTGRKVNKEQIQHIKEALRNNNYVKLTPKESAKHRSKFTSSLKDKLIAEWDEKTNQKWPRYKEEVIDKNGEVVRNIGQPYDAHHIIENNFGGPHAWWNIHPAKYPDEHQAGIHGKGAPSGKLFSRR